MLYFTTIYDLHGMMMSVRHREIYQLTQPIKWEGSSFLGKSEVNFSVNDRQNVIHLEKVYILKNIQNLNVDFSLLKVENGYSLWWEYNPGFIAHLLPSLNSM